MSTRTLWISPTDWVSGDATLCISYPSVEHPATEVTTTTPGDLKWVFLGLRLPPCTEIKAVRICYQVSNSRSFISQLRLTEMKVPDRALVRHDDSTDLTSVDPTSHVSEVANLRLEGAITLALRLNFDDCDDKIVLGSVGVDLRSYGSLAPICDIRFSLQSRYATATDLRTFGITNHAVTISGSALLAPSETTVSDFIAKTESEIREALENHLASHKIDANTNHLVVIDMEPQDTSTDPPRNFSPRALGTWEGDPRQDQIIEGYKKRIAVAREVFLNAKLALYQVIVPNAQGQENDEFRQRMQGYQRAGELGMYDQLDYLVPVLYTRFGPRDVHGSIDLDTIHGWIEASTRQAIESSLTLTRTNGEPLALAPTLSFWVFNGNSRHDRMAILPETMRRQLRILQAYCAVKIIVLWSGWETRDEMMRGPRPVEPIDIRDFLTNVGELPPLGCE